MPGWTSVGEALQPYPCHGVGLGFPFKPCHFFSLAKSIPWQNALEAVGISVTVHILCLHLAACMQQLHQTPSDSKPGIHQTIRHVCYLCINMIGPNSKMPALEFPTTLCRQLTGCMALNAQL